jgi:RimK family alpha-L-glutamate ligase
VEGVYYLQQYINSGEGAWHDYRVFVIQGKAVAAMKRHGSGWVNNVALGGRCESYAIDSEIAALAIQAADAVDIDYCGVDVIRDADDNMYVLEVNSIPAWKGLQGVVRHDIAQLLVDDFLAKAA